MPAVKAKTRWTMSTTPYEILNARSESPRIVLRLLYQTPSSCQFQVSPLCFDQPCGQVLLGARPLPPSVSHGRSTPLSDDIPVTYSAITVLMLDDQGLPSPVKNYIDSCRLQQLYGWPIGSQAHVRRSTRLRPSWSSNKPSGSARTIQIYTHRQGSSCPSDRTSRFMQSFF